MIKVFCATQQKMKCHDRSHFGSTFKYSRKFQAKALPSAMARTNKMLVTVILASVAPSLRAGITYRIDDADIQNFYENITTGSGGDSPEGLVLSELIVNFCRSEYTAQGSKSDGLRKRKPPGKIGKNDIAIAMRGLKALMEKPKSVTKGGVGYGVDETRKVLNDGMGWVWVAAEMSPEGLVFRLLQSVPYGLRAVLVARQGNVNELFSKVNWNVAAANVDKIFAVPPITQP